MDTDDRIVAEMALLRRAIRGYADLTISYGIIDHHFKSLAEILTEVSDLAEQSATMGMPVRMDDIRDIFGAPNDFTHQRLEKLCKRSADTRRFHLELLRQFTSEETAIREGEPLDGG